MYQTYEKKTLDQLHQAELKILEDFDFLCKKHKLRYILAYGTCLGAVRHQGFIPWDDDIDVAMPRADWEKFCCIDPQEMDGKYVFTCLSKKDRALKTLCPHFWRRGTTFFAGDITCSRVHYGICIDIFPFDVVPLDLKLRSKMRRQSAPWRAAIRLQEYVPFSENSSWAIKLLHLPLVAAHWLLQLLPATFLSKHYDAICTRYRHQEGEKGYGYAMVIGGMENGKLAGHRVFQKETLFPVKDFIFENKKFCGPNNVDCYLRELYGEDYMKLPPKEQQINHAPQILKFCDED